MEPIPNFNMIIIHFLTRQSLYVSPVVKRGLDVFLKQFKYTSSEKYMYILFLNYKKPKKYINTHYPFYTFAKAALNSNINLVLNIDSNSSHKHEICHNFRIIHILNLQTYTFSLLRTHLQIQEHQLPRIMRRMNDSRVSGSFICRAEALG